jgi:hypothetical protein
MGVLRKTAIVMSGGAPRVAIKPNSKKIRIANASEKQVRQNRKLIRQAKGADSSNNGCFCGVEVRRCRGLSE